MRRWIYDLYFVLFRAPFRVLSAKGRLWVLLVFGRTREPRAFLLRAATSCSRLTPEDSDFPQGLIVPTSACTLLACRNHDGFANLSQNQ
jgi:hypothetical protein